jgi:hypothetical protein
VTEKFEQVQEGILEPTKKVETGGRLVESSLNVEASWLTGTVCL